MLHLGDITKISGRKVPVVDCVSFGAPCQDISVAGKQKGMKHEAIGSDETTRSGLVFDAIRIIKEMRERDVRENGRSGVDVRPRYAVYENVPGATSSQSGEDFRTLLEEIAKIADENAVIPRPKKWATSGCIVADGWSLAWRILDAHFWGTPDKPLPQRRRRISLIADFGGQSAPEILFVRQSVSGDIEPGEPQRKENESVAERSTGTGGAEKLGFDGYNHAITGEVSSTLGVNCGLGTGRSGIIEIERQPLVVGKTVFSKSKRAQNPTDFETWQESDTANTLNAFDTGDVRANEIVIALDRASFNQGKNTQFDIGIDENGTEQSLVAKGPGAVCCRDRSSQEGRVRYILRRLTPLECERLQGYPDGWTDIGEWTDSDGKKKKSSDSARYKALGNSIAIPPWKWVVKRLCACYERDATLASLFDGIGGFPYIWEQLNGKGSCLWASEVEEFPMAVTKLRIGG